MEAEHALMELPHNGQLAATSLYLPPTTKKGDFLEILQKLSHVGHGYWWWIADAAMFGVHRYGPEIIPEIAKTVGCSPEYIRALSQLAVVYPVRDRIPGLSITHHRSAARLRVRAKRMALLRKAKERRLSTHEVVNLARAREKRRVHYRLTISPQTDRNPKFQAAWKAFCKTWNVSWWVWGSKRHVRTKLAGQRRAFLA